MPRKVSIKKYLKVGSVIRTSENGFWEITFLGETTFECKRVDLIGRDDEYTQRFNYNIEMVVYERIASN